MLPNLLSFLDRSPCSAFAADSLEQDLTAAGFIRLEPTAPRWGLTPGKYLVRSGAAVVAFVLRSATVRRFALVGAHTDSPHLHLKPNAAHTCEGCLQMGVEVYGGALTNSWLDRDLGLAGTVFTEDGQAHGIRLARPLARVAQLAIHLDRKLNDEGLKLNPQLHLAPLWGLDRGTDAGHEFTALLAEATGVPAASITGHDLALYDLTPATRGGVRNELIFSGRLDNLASCHAGLQALLASAEGPADTVPVLACFDHEEVGSQSRDGAEGGLLATTLERLALEVGLDRGGFLAALAGSLMISADMAHAAHPNYADRHEPRHKPRLGGGPVLKSNANQRYATSGATAAYIRGLARRHGIPLQDFVTRTDLGCGSTIGPACAARLGVAVADLGTPMLSMHSARECAAAEDHGHFISLLTAHFRG